MATIGNKKFQSKIPQPSRSFRRLLSFTGLHERFSEANGFLPIPSNRTVETQTNTDDDLSTIDSETESISSSATVLESNNDDDSYKQEEIENSSSFILEAIQDEVKLDLIQDEERKLDSIQDDEEKLDSIQDDEDKTDDQIDDQLQSSSSVTLPDTITSDIFSGTDDLQEEGSTTSFLSSQSMSFGEKITCYSIDLHEKCREIEFLTALQAFKPMESCDLEIHQECARYSKEETEPTRKIAQGNYFISYDLLKKSGTRADISMPKPALHNAIATIDQIENILEMVLTIGFKMSKRTRVHFGGQQVPTPIHNAMSDIKTFLEPLKTQIQSSMCGSYFRVLTDPVDKAILPIFNHLNDAIIALESPATYQNYTQLLWEDDLPDWQEETIQNIYQMAAMGSKYRDSSFMSHTMNMFYQTTGSKYFTQIQRPRVHSWGLIEIPFLNDIQVVLTMDLGILVINRHDRLVIALSADGSQSGIKYRYGECCQRNELIEVACVDAFFDVHKRVRMTPKGVSFQDEQSPITYLLSTSGVKTCQKICTTLDDDFIGEIFYAGSRFGSQFIGDCCEMLGYARHQYDEDGSISWIINNLKIKQSPDGQVILHKDNAEYTIIATPNTLEDDTEEECWTHSARLTTPNVHITCGVSTRDRGNKYHFYVKQDSKKMFACDQKFIIRYNSHTAGIDKYHKIYLSDNN